MGSFPEIQSQRFFVCGFLVCGLTAGLQAALPDAHVLLDVVEDGDKGHDPVRERGRDGEARDAPAREAPHVRLHAAEDEVLLGARDLLAARGLVHEHAPLVPHADAAALYRPSHLAPHRGHQEGVELHPGQGVLAEVRPRQQALRDVVGSLQPAEVEEPVAEDHAPPVLGPPVLLQLVELLGAAVGAGVAPLKVVLHDRLEARDEGGVPGLEPDPPGGVGEAEAHDDEEVDVVEVAREGPVLTVDVHDLRELEEVLPLDEGEVRGQQLPAVRRIDVAECLRVAVQIARDADPGRHREDDEAGQEAEAAAAPRPAGREAQEAAPEAGVLVVEVAGAPSAPPRRTRGFVPVLLVGGAAAGLAGAKKRPRSVLIISIRKMSS